MQTVHLDDGTERMPRFFLNVRNHESFRQDLFGSEFATINEAHDKAIETAALILAGKPPDDDTFDGFRFEIATEEGVVLLVVPFRSALRSQ